MATPVPGVFNVSEGHLEMTSLMYNVTFDSLTNSTGDDSSGGDPCREVTSIPGVISNQTMQGLWAFSGSYSAVHGYVSTAVCLFGLMSNTANIIVLTRKNMITSTNTILMWLAVADLLTMMSYLPFAIHFYIMREPDLGYFHTRSFGWIIFLLFHASFSIVCHTVAIWLTIALAIFRYIYICMPTKGSIYCSLRRAKITIFVVYALTVVVCVPNYFTNRYKEYEGGLNPTASSLLLPNNNVSAVTAAIGLANQSGPGEINAFDVAGQEREREEEEGGESAVVYGPVSWSNSEAAEIIFLTSFQMDETDKSTRSA
ncbi:hypothetical protein ACOMHN_067095 [Nucella lapillus]